VVFQVTKTCPSVCIYVSKVAARRDGDKADVDRPSVARAIIHDAKPVEEAGWGVDIINMSYDWDEADLPN
jgi:hypothetical protein